MRTHAQAQAKATPTSSFTPVRSPLLQRCAGSPCHSGECDQRRKKKRPELQRYPAGPAKPTTVPPIVEEVLRSPGQPLDSATRAYMEPRFGHDFSRVRVHTDARAAQSARAVNALAYTVGGDVVLASGRYSPRTGEGRRLLAHELTHVVQQGGAAPQSAVTLGQPGGRYEHEAGRVADWVSSAWQLTDFGAHGMAQGKAHLTHGAKRVGGVSQVSTRRLQRAAASCPKDWATTVRHDHDRALRMIDVARRKLSSYNGTTPPEVATALAKHFKSTSAGFAGWVNFNLGFLRLMAPLAGYDCEDTASWWCGSRTLAKTLWCVPFVDIRVCQPAYFGQSDRERSATLIHEWVHKYGCNFDLGYSHEPDYPSQWTISALLNADPFSEFVKEVQ